MLTRSCVSILLTSSGDVQFIVLLSQPIKSLLPCGWITNPPVLCSCPTFQRRLSPDWCWFRSAHTDTVIGLNTKTQNRLQPAPAGPLLLFMLLPRLKPQFWILVMQSQRFPFIFTRDRPANQGEERERHPNISAYLHVIV